MHRSPHRPVILAFLALVALSLVATACTRIASPRGWASPIATDDVLVVANRDELFGLDLETGDALWRFPPDGEDIDVEALYGTPGSDGELVFVPAHEGSLYAVDAASGDLRWGPFETDGPLIGGVLVSQDALYFGSSDGNVYALDAASGDLRWNPFETGDGVWSTPALAGDTLYVTSLDGRLYALDPATGSERWSFATGAGIAASPVVDSQAGLVFVGGFDSRLHAIDVETHEERWSLKSDNWFWARPLLADGFVYAASLDGKLYAADALTGDARWPQPFSAQAPIRSAPVIAGGRLIAIDRDGNVYGIDPEDGSAGAPLAVGSDVLADPLVRASTDSEAEADVVELVITTTDGELIRIDVTTLQILGRRKLTGD